MSFFGDKPVNNRNATYGAVIDASNATGTLITAGATANTKGAWTQLVAATDFDSDGMLLTLSIQSAHPYAFDIAIGASGSEQIIVNNILLRGINGSNYYSSSYLPITIPAGTRISVRSQSTTASSIGHALVHLFGESFLSSKFAGVETVGANVTASGTDGTYVLYNGTANTWSSWVQLTAATQNEFFAMFLSDLSYINAAADFMYEIGIGASGSEQAIMPTMHLRGDLYKGAVISPTFPIRIPAGSRLSMRARSSISGGAQYLVLTAYGLY
jgi:hypothetical protein